MLFLVFALLTWRVHENFARQKPIINIIFLVPLEFLPWTLFILHFQLLSKQVSSLSISLRVGLQDTFICQG